MPGAQQLLISYAAAAAGYDPATTAWVNQVVTNGGTVSGTEKGYVDTLIVGLKADGLFTKLDRLWLHASENTFQALVDIIADATATAVNSPTFTTNRGYTGQDLASPTKYIDTGFNPSTAGGNYTQNAAHLSAWCVGNVASTNGGTLVGLENTNTNVQANIYDTFSDGNLYVRINDGPPSGSQGAPATRAGHWLINRNSSTTSQAYKNGVNFSSPNQSSGALINGNFRILCDFDVNAVNLLYGTPNQIAMTSFGGNLSATDAANFYSRLAAYMASVTAQAWANQVVTNGGTVSGTEQGYVTTLIQGLMLDGVWGKLDRLWLYASENSFQALVDVVTGATATAVNSPTFTTNRGFTGNGTVSYVDTGFNPTTATSPNYVQNAASIGIWSNSGATTSGNDLGMQLGTGTQWQAYIDIKDSGSTTYFAVSDNSGGSFNFNVADASGLGWYFVNRSGATASQAYINGSQVATSANASGAPLNVDFFTNRDAGKRQLCAVTIGGNLSSTDATNFYNRLRTYMTSVGVP